MNKWITITDSYPYPPENVKLRFKGNLMMFDFECEGTVVYKNCSWYRDKCFSDGEEREMLEFIQKL